MGWAERNAQRSNQVTASSIVDSPERRAAQDAAGWKPAQPRPRKVTTALKAYALLATSADKGAVRDRALLDAV